MNSPARMPKTQKTSRELQRLQLVALCDDFDSFEWLSEDTDFRAMVYTMYQNSFPGGGFSKNFENYTVNQMRECVNFCALFEERLIQLIDDKDSDDINEVIDELRKKASEL